MASTFARIIPDTTKALRGAFPTFECEAEEIDGKFVITVMDASGMDVPYEQVLHALEVARDEAIKQKDLDDHTWRALSQAVRSYRSAESMKELNKEMEEFKDTHKPKLR